MADEHDDEQIGYDASFEQGDVETGEDPLETGGEDEFSIEIDGDESEDELLREGEDDTPLQKKLRAKLKDEIRAKHELAKERDELKRAQTAAEPEIVVGDEPDLESCEWDEIRLKKEWREWEARRAAAENRDAIAQRRAQESTQRFEAAKSTYLANAGAKGLNVTEAEQSVMAKLSPAWLGSIIMYSKDPEVIVSALYRHPAKLDQIAAEPDDVKKMRLLWELEGKVIVNRKKPPAPEADTIQRGSAAAANPGSDKEAAKLLATAQKTGNMDPYREYMKTRRAA